jgi:exodeoxyribonuclease VII large subunit
MIDIRPKRDYPTCSMLQQSQPQEPVYSVADLTAYIRALLESNENLMSVWVAGEVSNVSRPSSGHVYFTLKDSAASLRCVIWRDQASRLAAPLRDGMALEAHGSVSVYEQGGQYQLYVDGLRAAGEGLLYQEFLRLKAKLEAEGLFAEERKRPLPELPRVVGVITSPTGAALQDILNTLRNRCPLVRVVLAPAAVQGENAPAQLVAALTALNRFVQPDVILLARGGGSLEDLWSFNDERVVRAIAASSAPVISGVGHETDFTLADFAADLRAPTPTAAAVMAVPDKEELSSWLDGQAARLRQELANQIGARHLNLREIDMRLEQQSPRWHIHQGMQRLDDLSLRLRTAVRTGLKTEPARLVSIVSRMDNLDPARVLRRGYALVQDSAGGLIRSLKRVQLGQNVRVSLQDGAFHADVKEIDNADKGEE